MRRVGDGADTMDAAADMFDITEEVEDTPDGQMDTKVGGMGCGGSTGGTL